MDESPLWVFGYGSLMWEPGFEHEERAIATLPGYARTFCMRSIHHRGTSERPGLVLALDAAPGEECNGVAFSVAPRLGEKTLRYLRERELVSSAYLEKILQVDLVDGRRIEAVAYVVDTQHVQYCKGLPLEEQAEIISAASGGRGSNAEYLYNTAMHLEELGIEDLQLSWLADRVRRLEG